MSLTFSVVIPALNEAARIEACLAAVLAEAAAAPDLAVEVIVATGDSEDETAALARGAGAEVVTGARGRGVQCNAGAARAAGDVLLFLHADTRLPAGAFPLLRRHFQDPGLQAGTFRLGFDEEHWLYDVYTAFSRFDSVLTSFGDQCIVIRRPFFEKIGGFPDWPLFEDVRLLQKTRARTRLRSFPARVTTSARRFAREGVIRQSLRNGWYVLQYLCGASPHDLAARYESRHTGAKIADH